MAGSVDLQAWHALESALSRDRLATYRTSADPDYDAAIARHLWNCALCESLYPLLQGAEVALRNTMDGALVVHCGPSWHTNSAFFGPRDQQSIADAIDKLERRGKTRPTRGDVVAEVSFGFWVSLFTRYYERPNRFWPALSAAVMAGAPRIFRWRQTLHDRLDDIRELRNRAFHHEPIWHWQDLERRHARALETLGWFSPRLADLTTMIDRFTTVRARGADAYEGLLEGAVLCPLHNVACRVGIGDICPLAPAAFCAPRVQQ